MTGAGAALFVVVAVLVGLGLGFGLYVLVRAEGAASYRLKWDDAELVARQDTDEGD